MDGDQEITQLLGQDYEEAKSYSYKEEGLTVPSTAPYSKKGYTFEGWYDAFTGGNKVTKIEDIHTEDVILHARWKAEVAPTATPTATPTVTPTIIPAPTIKDKHNTGKYKIIDPKKKEVVFDAPVNKKAKEVTIPKQVEIDGKKYKVTEIGANAFKGNTKVTTIHIGDNVKTIGEGAFSGCSGLKILKITSTKLTSSTMAEHTFQGISNATTIKVPKSKVKAYTKLFQTKGLSKKVKVKAY